MSTVIWPPNFPSGLEHMVANGDIAQVRHGLTIEEGIIHLIAWPFSHSTFVPAMNGGGGIGPGGVQTNTGRPVGAAGSGDEIEYTIYLLPFARDLEIWVLCEATTGTSQGIVITTDVAGSGTAYIDTSGMGALGQIDEGQWRVGVVTNVGDGTATCGGEVQITIAYDPTDHDPATATEVWAVTTRQLPVQYLEQT